MAQYYRYKMKKLLLIWLGITTSFDLIEGCMMKLFQSLKETAVKPRFTGVLIASIITSNVAMANIAFEYGHYDYYDNDDFYVRNLDKDTDFIELSISNAMSWIDTNIPFCADIVTNLRDCIPNICKENYNGLLHIRQVHGYRGDYCEMSEKFMYQGILNCKYKPEDDFDILETMDRIQNTPGIKILKPQAEKIERFYQSHCSLDVEDRYVNALFIAKDSYDYQLNNALALFINEPFINSEKMLVPYIPGEIDNTVKRAFWFDNSVSYSAEEYKVLSQIAEAFRGNDRSELAQIAQEVLQSVNRELKITAMLYFTPSKWSVWVNNTKFSSEDRGKRLQIQLLSGSTAKMLWNVQDIDRLSGDWRENYRKVKEGKFVSKDGRIILTNVGVSDYNLEFDISLGEILKLNTLLIEKESIK